MFDFLQPSVPIAKSFMRIPRISGIICGIWPQHKQSCIKLLFFGFNVFVVALGAVGENLYGFVYLNDLVNALEAFCPGVTKAICLLKMLVFFVFNHRWYMILERIRTILMAEQHCKKKMQIVQKLASIASIFSFILLISGTFTNMSFNLRPLVTNVIRHFQGQDIVNVLPFNIVIPEMFVNYPYYPVTYIILTLSGAMTVFTFSFVDGFFVCACMYMSGVFRMIQYDIRIIFAELKECETSSLAQNQRFRMQLTEVVKRHNAIIDLCSDFAANFTLIILMHFLSAALVLCSSILDLMLNSASLGLLIYIFYSIAALTQLFLYSFGGSYISESVGINFCRLQHYTKNRRQYDRQHQRQFKLQNTKQCRQSSINGNIDNENTDLEQTMSYCVDDAKQNKCEYSAAVADTLYDIEWYKCDAKTRKMILMMLRRSQKPTTIAVPFFTPSMSTFSAILSTAGSYITLLKTFL